MRKQTAVNFGELRSLVLIGLSVGLIGSNVPAQAQQADAGKAVQKPAPTAPSVSSDPMKDLKAVEKRFFFHEYDHDPIEKRLERIELLVFGAAQGGLNDARLAKIKAAVANRDREAAKRLADTNKSLKSQTPSSAPAPTSSAQYPILNTLEWRVLKKTFAKESLDQRLERLETSLFGQPSQAMAYADRIERLKKITGVDNTASTPLQTPTRPQGPLPRALGKQRSEYPFASPYISPMPQHEMDDDDTTFEQDLMQEQARMMRTMDDIMKQMGVNPGIIRPVPGMRHPFGNGYVIPNMPDTEGPSPHMIPLTPKPKKPKIPPYADPNSI